MSIDRYDDEDLKRMKTLIQQQEDPRASMSINIVKTPDFTGRRLRVVVNSRKGFSSVQEKRHQSAMDLLELVVNSMEFRDRVRAKTSFVSSVSTGSQVYDKIMTGAEELQPSKDYELDIDVILYEQNNSTVGWTTPSSIYVNVNNKFFKTYSLGEIGGNAMHEWLHKLGYGHTSSYTSVRDQSVPYALGYMGRDMIDDYVAGRLKLTDLYPLWQDDGKPVLDNNEKPVPLPVPPVEVARKKVCGWTWRFWLGKLCWYE